MAAEAAISFIVHTGDLAYPQGDRATYEICYCRVYAQLRRRSRFFPTPGNHDYQGDGGAVYRSIHSLPADGVPAEDIGRYYSFNQGRAHFVSLDSNALADESAGAERMLGWLEDDLSRTEQTWRIAYFHHAPYPTGHHRFDEISALARQQINPILERHGVQLVLSGHEHGYQRSYPLRADRVARAAPSTTYVITAGGGAEMQIIGFRPQTAASVAAYHYLRVDVADASIAVRAIGLDGQLIDQFELAACATVRPDRRG